MNLNLSSKEVALIVCFAAIYVVTSYILLFPLIGGEGRGIDASTIISLVIGLIIGPFLGGLAVLVGGLISISINSGQAALGPFTFIPHFAAAVCVGALKNKKQPTCSFAYLFAFLFFAFFPSIGPFWVWPQMLWFHIISMFIMASPLQSKAIENLSSFNPTMLTLGIATTFFTSTLFSQVIGSIVFEFLNLGNMDSAFWLGVWQGVTLLYPIERITITAVATLIAVPVLGALRSQGFKV